MFVDKYLPYISLDSHKFKKKQQKLKLLNVAARPCVRVTL